LYHIVINQVMTGVGKSKIRYYHVRGRQKTNCIYMLYTIVTPNPNTNPNSGPSEYWASTVHACTRDHQGCGLSLEMVSRRTNVSSRQKLSMSRTLGLSHLRLVSKWFLLNT